MAIIRSHGGGCCGIRHIHSFTGHETKEEIGLLLRQTYQHATQGMLVEVVLTNAQCRQRQGHTPRILQELGFKLVSRFRNPNSGNICNVFHYNMRPRPISNRLPFKLIPSDAEVAAQQGAE